MRIRLTTFILVVSVVMLVAGDSAATTMMRSTIEKLTHSSESVVRVTTLETRVDWDEHRRIVTTGRFRVLENLHGSLAVGSEVEVATFGGALDGIVFSIAGAPRFAVGQEAVLFLGRYASGAPLGVVDLAQGKFEVTRAPDGTTTLRQQDLAGVNWVDQKSGAPVGLGELRLKVTEASRLTR
jgi:hypothetical protein